MPLARIITRSPEESRELAAKLRARGYSVEMVSPEQIPETAADVEVTLEECTPEEALIKAGLVFDVKDFEVKDLCVFIAPGAIAGPRPIAEIPFIAPQQQDSAPLENLVSLPNISSSAHNETQRSVRNDETAVRRIGEEKLGREHEQAAKPVSVEPSRSASEVYVYQDAVLSPLQRLRLPQLRLPGLRLPRVSLRIPRPSFRLPRWSLPHFSWPPLSLRPPRLRLRLPRLSFRLPHWALRVRRINLGIPRPSFRMPQFLLNRGHSAILAPALQVRRPRLPIRSRLPRSSAAFWDGAVALGILAVSVLLVVGLVHRPAAMPAAIVERSQRTEQRVPFAAIKPVSRAVPAQVVSPRAKSAGAPVQAPPVAVQKEKLPPKTQIAKPAPAVSKSALISRSKVTSTVRRHRSTSAEGDYVAEDVVVHYGQKASPRSAPAPIVRSDLN
jgi:hypothetical protein